MKSKWWKPSKISWIDDEEEVDYHRRKTMKNYVPMGVHNDSYKMFNGLVAGLPVARFFHIWQGHDVDKKFTQSYYQEEKIVLPIARKTFEPLLVASNVEYSSSYYNLTFNDDYSYIDIYFVYAYLGSTLANFAYQAMYGMWQEKNRISSANLKNFPIWHGNAKQKEEISIKALEIIALQKLNTDNEDQIQKIKKEIDRLVYAYCMLTEQEISYVENAKIPTYKELKERFAIK